MKAKIFTFLFILALVPAQAYFLQESKVATTGRIVVDKQIYDENRAIKLHIHGDGVYSTNQRIYGDIEKMKYEEDTTVSKIGNLSWTDDLCLKNYEIYSAVRERYSSAEFIDKETKAYMDKNETYVEISSSFEGAGYLALKNLKTVYVNAYEYYVGTFDIEKVIHLKLNKTDLSCP